MRRLLIVTVCRCKDVNVWFVLHSLTCRGAPHLNFQGISYIFLFLLLFARSHSATQMALSMTLFSVLFICCSEQQACSFIKLPFNVEMRQLCLWQSRVDQWGLMLTAMMMFHQLESFSSYSFGLRATRAMHRRHG